MLNLFAGIVIIISLFLLVIVLGTSLFGFAANKELID